MDSKHIVNENLEGKDNNIIHALEITHYLFEIRNSRDENVKRQEFKSACTQGHIDTAKWYYDVFVNYNDPIHKNVINDDVLDEVFLATCCSMAYPEGTLIVAKWLFQKINAKYAKEQGNGWRHWCYLLNPWTRKTHKNRIHNLITNTFEEVYRNGHSELIIWLFQIICWNIRN